MIAGCAARAGTIGVWGSNLAWLDTSRDDRQRMRELVNMFSDKETLDELGIGQVSDALSDMLFPGTSTLHTRARYLLIIPWCYLRAERVTQLRSASARPGTRAGTGTGRRRRPGCSDDAYPGYTGPRCYEPGGVVWHLCP